MYCDRTAEKYCNRTNPVEPQSYLLAVSLLEALTPDGGTKAAYSGEFSEFIEIDNPDYDDEDSDGEPYLIREVTVSWTTIKKIMGAINRYAEILLAQKEGQRSDMLSNNEPKATESPKSETLRKESLSEHDVTPEVTLYGKSPDNVPLKETCSEWGSDYPKNDIAGAASEPAKNSPFNKGESTGKNIGDAALRAAWERGRAGWCPATILDDWERTERDWVKARADLAERGLI
jgi:hypothetical protein